MAKGKIPQPARQPSKAQLAKNHRRYAAEEMARDAVLNTPRFDKAVRKAETQLVQVETMVSKTMKGKKGK